MFVPLSDDKTMSYLGRWWKNWDEWKINSDSWGNWDGSKSSWGDWSEWKSSCCGWKTKWRMLGGGLEHDNFNILDFPRKTGNLGIIIISIPTD